MNIHEHQAKELLHQFGIPTPDGKVAFSVREAGEATQQLPGPIFVVKAQIHAGGRGKGKFKESSAGEKGGVRLAKSRAEVQSFAEQMLGATLVTVQTGPDGRAVNRIYVTEGVDIERELYLSALIDRATSRVAFIASAAGGMNIEEVAHSTRPRRSSPSPSTRPAATCRITVGASPSRWGSKASRSAACVKLVGDLYNLVIAKDMSMLEINPLVVMKDGSLSCLDAKMSFDSNALYRHPDIVAMRDLTEEDPAEVEASKYDLSYVKLDGTIGCMVNGAGLAMATMDIIKLYGAEPANFLDVGGGASKEKVQAAFKIILSDPAVKGILVNIFGGIMRCDIIAEGVVAAAREMAITVPLVVRLEGTNVELGKKILAESGLKITPADDLGDAAEKITAAVKAAA